VDKLTKNQPLLQQIAVLEDLSVQTGLSVASLRNLSKAAAELNSRTEDTITLDQRYSNEVANLGKSISSISESLQKLLAAGMWPFVSALSYAAKGVAWLLDYIRQIPGVFETLAFVGGVVAVGAVGLLVNSIRQLAIWAPVAMAGVRALNAQLMGTTVGAAVSGAMAAGGLGGGAAGASTGIGAMFMNFLINPLKVIFVPIAKGLAALLSPLGIAVVALTALAAYFVKKDVDLIREIRDINKSNDNARAVNAEQIRSDLIRRSSQVRGASISTDEDLTEAERLKTLSVVSSGGNTTNFGDLLANREKMIAGMMRGEGGTQAISDVQAAQFKNELAQRDVIYLRNAIAAQQNQLVTENRPINRDEAQQLALMTDMVKYLERQVNITQSQSDDAKKRQDEEDQYQQLIRVKSMGAGAH
jgi:hypothetical protein